MNGAGSPVVRIIGGGMTGLTLGLRLARRGFTVAVHERDPYLGGLAGETSLAGVPVERFYHCVLPTDTALLSLFTEIGLGDAVGWTKTRTGFFADRRLIEMTTAGDFLRFPALGLLDRLRLGWTIAYCGVLADWRGLDQIPIGKFLKRHGGKRLFESIWEPLLLAKLGPEYDRFAASFIWATIYRMLSARKAKGKAEKLGYVKQRYGRVFVALRKAIESAGGTVHAGSVVNGVEPSGPDSGARWRVRVGDESLPAGGVILCVPAPAAAALLGPAIPAGAAGLTSVDYLGVVCELLLLRRSLTPYYVLNLTDRQLPFTGVIETSNLTGREEFGGHALVYLPRYRDQASELWNRDDEGIHRENMAGLRTIIADLNDDDVLAWRIHRARYVQPVHPVGWGERVPPVRLAEGLAYLSTAQIHPWPVFNDEVVRLVDGRLEEVVAALQPNRA